LNNSRSVVSTNFQRNLMSNYPNLQRSLFFKVLPLASQIEVLKQADISAACYELQIQLEQNAQVMNEYLRRYKNGEEINALAELGLQCKWPGDLTDEEWQMLAELDPVNYHSSSTKLTPLQKEKWDAFIKKCLSKEAD